VSGFATCERGKALAEQALNARRLPQTVIERSLPEAVTPLVPNSSVTAPSDSLKVTGNVLPKGLPSDGTNVEPRAVVRCNVVRFIWCLLAMGDRSRQVFAV
jgi:hypothetical protein